MVEEQGMDPIEPQDYETVLTYLADHFGWPGIGSEE